MHTIQLTVTLIHYPALIACSNSWTQHQILQLAVTNSFCLYLDWQFLHITVLLRFSSVLYVKSGLLAMCHSLTSKQYIAQTKSLNRTTATLDHLVSPFQRYSLRSTHSSPHSLLPTTNMFSLFPSTKERSRPRNINTSLSTDAS